MKSVQAAFAFAVCAIAAPAPSLAAPDAWPGLPAAQRPPPGTPNLVGVWQMPTRIVTLKTLDGQDPPLLPAARAAWRRNAQVLKADPDSDPVAKCWMHGVPRLLYAPYPVLIAQEKDRINFVHEVNHTFRVVSLTKPLPKDVEALDPLWLGYSAGRWVGRTLVIDSAGFNDKSWLDYSGLPHSDKLKVREEYRLAGPDTIEGRVTITDPLTFAKPWTTAFTLVRKPGYDLKESVCSRDRRM